MTVIRTPVFRKLFLAALLLVTASFIALNSYLLGYITQRELNSGQRRLEISGRLLANEEEQVPPSDLQSWARQAAGRVEARITVISDDGAVLADSESAPESME